MKLRFIGVNAGDSVHLMILYKLLGERTEAQSISHKEMPSYFSHVKFVQSLPYKHWYILEADGDIAGAIYLSYENEIGIFIFKEFKGQGIGPAAIKKLMLLHEGPYLANINPFNLASIEMFEELGFKQLQVTYAKQ